MKEELREALEACYRAEYGSLLAGLLRRCAGDFELAEAALSDAFTTALERWSESGLPDRPGAWIRTVADRRLTDRLRQPREERLEEASAAPQPELPLEHDLVIPPEHFPHEDDRLRLVFTCCHPALSQDAQVALTLNALLGLRAAEIARAFLVREVTLSQRLVRAKRKVRAAAIPYRLPPRELFAERLGAVLRIVYLVFNEGYVATFGERLTRGELCDEGLRLARLLKELLPEDPEVEGLLALLLLLDSRRNARVGEDEQLVLLSDQDRSLWNTDSIAEGCRLLRQAMGRGRPGSYQLQAAIASMHAVAPDWEATDWHTIVDLYDGLMKLQPSPVVALNRAVAVAMDEGPQKGLDLVEEIVSGGQLENYLYLHSTRADFLRQLNRKPEARAAYLRALELADNALERRFLSGRLSQLEDA